MTLHVLVNYTIWHPIILDSSEENMQARKQT